jgi:lipid II isoglutaminyl synthase (glutamine-hydrolysing)
MPLLFTLLLTKLALKATQLAGRGGAALPGLLAEKLHPLLAARLTAQLPKGVILVTGTNGKTTTTRLIAAMLEADGERVLTNRTGSNLKRGVLSALIAQVDWRGRSNATVGLFEVDEATLRKVAPELQPRQIVVTNLFRDQLDRYGELDTTAALIGQGIAATQAHLYLNADDPLVASLAKYAQPERVTFFGIEGLPAGAVAIPGLVADSGRCPACGTKLHFGRVFYGHLGHYRCTKCNVARPQPAVAITSVEEASVDGAVFTVAINSKRYGFEWELPGTYNLYNALAAIALTSGLGVVPKLLQQSLQQAVAVFGRVEKVVVQNRTLYLLLIKNPAGFAQVMETFLLGQRQPSVLVAINDNFADGRDVSWLWDVPLELLEPARPKLVASGIRATDMALRFHYAGLACQVEDDLDLAIDWLLTQTPEGGRAFILPTYTAMWGIRKALASRATIERVKV